MDQLSLLWVARFSCSLILLGSPYCVEQKNTGVAKNKVADILVAFVMRQHNFQQDCEEIYLNKRVCEGYPRCISRPEIF
ncbi:hypothetical protein SAMN04487897_13219 [Paenibacillus sp. yr247]|nr:hypothetical protein SAMN04487897_13219 [Paenibacillus sp. yr247]